MAEVVQQQGAQAAPPAHSGVFTDLGNLGNWIVQYWYIWVGLLLLVIIIAIGVYFFLKLLNSEKRKDQMYVFFEHTIEACKLNRQRSWIKKRRKWWFLLFGFLTSPIFGVLYLYAFLGEHWFLFWCWIAFGFLMWLPFVFIFYTDLSMRVINVDNRTIGFYRGHCTRMDGFIYVLLRVGRKWVVMEDVICVKLPYHVLTTKTTMKKDKEGNVTQVLEGDLIDIDKYVWNERDNYIKIPMTTLCKEDTYYFSPTLVDEKNLPLDLRQKIQGSYHFATGIQMSEQMYSQLGKVTNNAVDSNPHVVARKKEPDKERDSSANTAV